MTSVDLLLLIFSSIYGAAVKLGEAIYNAAVATGLQQEQQEQQQL